MSFVVRPIRLLYLVLSCETLFLRFASILCDDFFFSSSMTFDLATFIRFTPRILTSHSRLDLFVFERQRESRSRCVRQPFI